MSDQKRSYNARAVVTGAGSGIGREFALELARRGSRVVAADLNLDAAQDTVVEIERLGGEALAVACDVADEQAVRDLGSTAKDWFGAPSLVINNAGIGTGGTRIGDGRLEAWHRAIDVNMWGVIHGCDVFTPMLRERSAGGIINIASAAGFAAAPGMAPYSVGKAGVITVSETLAAELQRTGVAVTVVCPTFVPTNIFDGDLIDDASRKQARDRAAKSKLSPHDIAVRALNANDRGRLYLLPQSDAKVVWLFKRLLPTVYMRAAARLAPLPD